MLGAPASGSSGDHLTWAGTGCWVVQGAGCSGVPLLGVPEQLALTKKCPQCFLQFGGRSVSCEANCTQFGSGFVLRTCGRKVYKFALVTHYPNRLGATSHYPNRLCADEPLQSGSSYSPPVSACLRLSPPAPMARRLSPPAPMAAAPESRRR